MRLSEVFESIQGEGAFAGEPALFIRTSGCNLNCSWCDTKYHIKGKEYSIKEVVKLIKKSKLKLVVWTGGEPALQKEEIKKAIDRTKNKIHMLETNATILDYDFFKRFDYISFSPKSEKDAKQLVAFLKENRGLIYDIKIVTDLKKIGREMLKYATVLMPLTTFTKKDLEIKKKVWNYCVKKGIRYSPRLHIDVWNNKRGY